MNKRPASLPWALAERARASLHDRFGWHLADVGYGHWDQGDYVSRCSVCRREMIKRAGEPWRLRNDG